MSVFGTTRLNQIYNFFKKIPQLDLNFIARTELPEQALIAKFLPRNCTVLELGGESGTTAIVIDKILRDPTQHIVVDPAMAAIKKMVGMKALTHSHFKTVRGFLGKNRKKQEELWDECKQCRMWDLKELEAMVSKKFDVLVVDCEGAFLPIVEDFPELLTNAKLIIIEMDGPDKNVPKLRKIIKDNNFELVHSQTHPYWNLGIKDNQIFKPIETVNDLKTLKINQNIIGFHEVWVNFDLKEEKTKLKVVCISCNNPKWIELQYKLLKKFMKVEFEFIIFNDGKPYPDWTNDGDSTMRDQINAMCKNLGIKCIDMDNYKRGKEIQNASMRHALNLNYFTGYIKKNPDEYFLIDSDMFLVGELDMKRYREHVCGLILQSRRNGNLNYMWGNMFYLNTKKARNLHLLDFNAVQGRPTGEGADTGGQTYKWLSTYTKNFPKTEDIRNTDNNYNTKELFYIKHFWSLTWDESEFPKNLSPSLLEFCKKDERNKNNKFWCEIYDNVFLHLRGGSGWIKEMKGKLDNSVLEDCLKSLY